MPDLLTIGIVALAVIIIFILFFKLLKSVLKAVVIAAVLLIVFLLVMKFAGVPTDGLLNKSNGTDNDAVNMTTNQTMNLAGQAIRIVEGTGEKLLDKVSDALIEDITMSDAITEEE
ncbi:hypothetical protein K9M74_01860 [Candidatus Woesearchaeota archaeon]|nr:hypothetical protein [Candidatus Woesearchaeota archaeon]